MKLTPLHDWAVVKPTSAENVTAGGLYIPDAAKEKPAEGVVESIGPGALEPEERYGKKKKKHSERKFIPTTIKPGDYVLYEKYASQTYKIGTTDRVLVRERDILGVLPGGAPQPRTAPRPLQLPAATSAPGSNSLVASKTRAITTVPARKGSVLKEKPVQKPAKKAAKKKAVKKSTAKKAVKKAAPAKKISAKKTVKTAVKKTAKKAAKKSSGIKGKAKPAKRKR